jgi:hypothetical protein
MGFPSPEKMEQVSNLPATSWHVENVPNDQQQPPL